MKKTIGLAFVAGFLLIAGGCTSMAFDPEMPGRDLPSPVVDDLLGHSIRVSLMGYNWIPVEDEPGRITARYEKSGGVIAVEIGIDYGADGWTVEYLRSKNLDYNARRSTIHKNYVRWINNLNKSIYTEYMEKLN